MANPTLKAFSQNTATGGTASGTFPAGIVAGDRLIVFESGPFFPPNPAGWDVLWQGGATTVGGIWTKIATGTESGTTITFGVGGGDKSTVIIAVIGDPAGYPVIHVTTLPNLTAPRFLSVTAQHADSLVLTFAGLRDGGQAPTASRGTVDVSVWDGSRMGSLLTHENISTDQEYWQFVESGSGGISGCIGMVVEMQAPAYTRGPSSAYNTAVMADSPWLYWPLAADAQDASGNGRHGTVTNRWNFGHGTGIGTAGDGSRSTGASGYIRSGSLAFPAGKLAVEVITELPNISAMIWSIGNNPRIDCFLTGGGPGFNDGSANIRLAQPNDGLHHVVMEFTQGSAFNASGGKIYVDGVARATTSDFTPFTAGTNTVQVSGWAFDNNYFLPAGHFVGGFAIYAGGLSAARVAAHWAALGTQTTGTGLPTDIAKLETMFSIGDLRTSKANGAGVYYIPDASRKRRHISVVNANRLGTVKAGATPGGKPSVQNSTSVKAAYNFQRGLFGDAAAGEMLLLFKVAADPPAVGDGRLYSFGSDGQICHIPYTDGQLYENFGSTARKTTTNPTQSFATKYVIYNVRSAAGAWSNHVDGVLNFSTATNTVGWNNQPFFGYDNDGNAALYELVAGEFFSEVLSTPDRAIAYAWLEAMRIPISMADNFAFTEAAIADPFFLPASSQIDNTGFTTEASEPLTLPTDKTGWTHFSPSVTGVYQLDTIGSNFDTGLAVYTGPGLGSLTLAASDQDSGGSGTSLVQLTMTAGTTYHVQVGSGTGSASGTIMKLTLTAIAVNAALADPVVLAQAYSSIGVGLLKGRTNQASDALPGA